LYSDWKTVLYEYMKRKNQMDVDYSLLPLTPLLVDDQVIRRKKMLLQRLQEGFRVRQAQPVRNETRARLLDVTEDDRRITADLELRIMRTYKLMNREHAEERIEREKLTLFREGMHWFIGKIEEAVFERRPYYHEPSFSDFLSADNPRVSPAPFLNLPLLSRSESSLRAIAYDRRQAVLYADRHWDRANPEFIEFEVDCTNYISQCLFAGHAPMNYTGKRESGWWYRGRQNGRELWSYSWSVAHSLESLLRTGRTGLRGELVDTPEQLSPGDVIIYDWDGDGRYQHSVIVTAFDAAGMPLVNAHTTNSKHRYWDYRDSYAWTPQTVYRFFRIADYF